MTKRAMIALAASAALVPAALAAQTVPGPDPFYGAPSAGEAQLALQSARPPMMRHNPPMAGTGVHHGPGAPPQVMVMRRHGVGNNMGQMHNFHAGRINRGGMVPHGWFGPRFRIRNWGLYGFPQPFPGGSWIRYYDDAYLIDRDGRVLDSRYGMDWDRYGERWDYDDRGAPAYADGNYRADDDWDDEDEDDDGDRWRDGYGRGAHVRVERHGGYGYGQPMPPPPPPPPGYGGYGYGYGYGGYGYGYGTVIVTETTVTTPPVVEMRTVYETVTERVRVAPRVHRRARCGCHAPRPAPRPAPSPHPGDRG